MDNQHRQIAGYRELTEEDVRKMNAVKQLGPLLQAVIDELKADDSTDKRWVAIGATHLQEGLMALTRSIAKPTFF